MGEYEIDDVVHQIGDRWIVAEWNAMHHQWQSSNRRPPKGMENSYCYTYARTLEGLRGEGIRTYGRRSDAVRAARRIYWIDNWEG